MAISLTVIFWPLLLAEAVHGGYNGNINPSLLKWPEALKACRDLNPRPTCDLSTQELDHLTFWNTLQLNTGSYYWIGARKRDVLLWQQSSKPVIEDLGCFEKPVDLKSSLPAFRLNSPLKCLSECKANYVALLGQNCFCLSADMLTSYAWRPREVCHLNCYSEFFRCGGDNSSLSVYAISSAEPTDLAKGSDCPWTFDTGSDGDFEKFVSSISDLEKAECRSPVLSVKQLLWLNGGQMEQRVTGRGACLAISYTGQQYSLAIRKCTESLPSICDCYITDSSMQMTSTQSLMPTTSAGELTIVTSTTESHIDSSTTPATVTDSSTTSTAESFTSTAAGFGTTSVTTSRARTVTSADTFFSSSRFETAKMMPPESNSTLLFPFHSMNRSEDILMFPGEEHGNTLSSQGQGLLFVAFTTDLIVGISVGVIAVLIILVVIVVVVLRRRKNTSSALLQDKKLKRGTSYPI